VRAIIPVVGQESREELQTGYEDADGIRTHPWAAFVGGVVRVASRWWFGAALLAGVASVAAFTGDGTVAVALGLAAALALAGVVLLVAGYVPGRPYRRRTNAAVALLFVLAFIVLLAAVTGVLTGSMGTIGFGGDEFADSRSPPVLRPGSELEDAVLRSLDLRDAQLADVNLARAKLGDTNLRGADLRGACLLGAELIDADLRGALLDDADLRSADLSSAQVDEWTTFNGAVHDDQTQWPNGFEPPADGGAPHQVLGDCE
jgi:hypothetical protein